MLAQQKEALTSLISAALETLGVTGVTVILERPKMPEHGDALYDSDRVFLYIAVR